MPSTPSHRVLRPLVALVFVAALGLVADPASADCTYLPDPAASVVIVSYPEDASIWIVPDGTGRRLDQAYDAQGNTVPLTIEVQLIDAMGVPMTTIAPEDIWLEDQQGSLAYCAGAWHPDAWDLDEGRFLWTGSVAGGGFNPPGWDVFVIKVCGTPLFGHVTTLGVNSPDSNGDLVVNLSDIARFVEDLGSTMYRSDFVHDGTVDLADVAVMVQAIGAGCP